MSRRILATALCAAALAAGEGAVPAPAAPAGAAATPAAAAAAGDPAAGVEPVEFPAAEQLSEAGRERLRAERRAFLAEITRSARGGGLDLARLQPAFSDFEAGAKDTPADNRARYGALLSAINPQFAKAWTAYRAGRWDEAATQCKPLMHEEIKLVKAAYKHNTMPPMQYTFVRFVQSECQARGGDVQSALIGYHVIYVMMPASLTVGAPSAWRPAEIYARTGRVHFAIWLMQAALRHNGEHLADLALLAVRNRADALLAGDPMRASLRLAREVHARLARGETGESCLEAQQRLLAEIRRMGPDPEVEPRPFLEHTNTIAEPADTGALKEGSNPEEFLTTGIFELTGSDDWGRLRAREKQQLLQLFQETYPQRYRDMLGEYFRALSALETHQEAPPAAGAQRR